MPTVSAARLEQICRSGVRAMGGSEAVADDMVASLISANIEGMDSHGMIRLPQYLRLMDEGLINPKAETEVVRRDRAVTLLDGHWGFGQVGARVATRMAIESAREHALGAAGIYHVLHVGRLKDFVLLVAKQNMLGLAMASAGPAGGAVAPYRGARARFGTNPIAFAVPRAMGEPVIGDFATSVTAEGKLRLAVNTKHKVADGTIIDKHGLPTNDPNEFYAGGALLPMALHKGYQLNLMVEIVGGLLVGSGAAALSKATPGNGFLIVAFDIAAFRPIGGFEDEMEELVATVKSTASAPGQPPVLLPGEPETIARLERSKSGIPVDDEVWASLKAMGEQLHLPASLFDLEVH